MLNKQKRKKTKKKKNFRFNNITLLFIIIILFSLLKAIFTPTETELEREAKIVLDVLTDGATDVSLLNSNGLVEERLRTLDEKDYLELKKMFGIKNDFCIFFEDITGDVIRMDNINSGIGSDKIYINGEPCE